MLSNRILSRPFVRRIALRAAAVIMTSAATVGLLAPPAAATDSSPAPVVFIVDASGSMVRDAGGRTRMAVAQEATRSAIEALPDATPTGLLVFGTGTGNDDSERAAGCRDVTTLSPVRPVDPTALGAAIDGIQASGFTPIGPALRIAAGMLPPDRAGSIVLVSDGVDTCAPPSSCEVAAQIHRDNPLLAIHVVGFGVDDDEEAQQQMTCIGGVGGGTAVSAADPTQLSARLRAAATAGQKTGTVGANGMNGVRLGMTLAEVRAAVDGARVGTASMRDGVEIIEVDCGWGTVEVRDGRVSAITPAEATTATAEGVSPVDGLAAFTRLYGTGQRTADGNLVFPVAPDSAIGYRVMTDGQGTIRQIVVCRCAALTGTAAPSMWTVDFGGIGPLVLGMTLNDARAAVPALAQRSEAVWTMTTSGGSALISAGFVDGRLAVVQAGPSSGMDANLRFVAPRARGIMIGDNTNLLIDAYPGGSRSSVYIEQGGTYIVTDRTGHVMRFRTSWNKPINQDGVASMRVEDAALTLRPDVRESFALILP